jgi:hypothetical protein
MGRNDSGALGDGTYGGNTYPFATNRPEQIVASGVTAIAGGLNHFTQSHQFNISTG